MGPNPGIVWFRNQESREWSYSMVPEIRTAKFCLPKNNLRCIAALEPCLAEFLTRQVAKRAAGNSGH